MAHPAPAPTMPVRAWRVDLNPDRTRWSCTAPGCPGEDLGPRRAPQAALGHLAGHAAAERLAPHLRTCRCHARGCAWHPRHRGCDGPVALVVFRQHGGRTWQLADACTACTRAIPHAAQLPPLPEPTAGCPRGIDQAVPVKRDPAAPAPAPCGLEAVLTYLDAALAPGTPAPARLFALLCLLRADQTGHARMPQGLLRAWRLADHANQCTAELSRQNWLHGSADGVRAVAVQIGDSTGTAVLRATSRRHRARLLHQAAGLLPHLPDADRLAALLPAPPPPRTPYLSREM
jgi:hypothetical protein